MITSKIDLTGLNQLIFELQDALAGYGNAPIFAKTIKHQAGLLAMEISNQLGPKNIQRGADKIKKDINVNFAEITVPVFPANKRGSGELQWLFGVKKLNYLVGVDPEDIQLGMSKEDMNRFKPSSRGVKWFEVARSIRGKKQRRVQLNRTIVERGKMKSLLDFKKSRVGRMRAVFAYAAMRCGQSKIPAWVSRHFSEVSTEGRAIFDESRLSGPSPQIAFGGDAPGLHKFEEQISDAVAVRSMKIADRIARIIKAFSQQLSSGQKLNEIE